MSESTATTATTSSTSTTEKKQQEHPELPPRHKAEQDEISERKKGLINTFYENHWKKLASEHPDWPTSFKQMDEDNQQVWCYKLMIARKFDCKNAELMLKDILAQRKEWKTEDRSYFPPPMRVKGYDMEHVAQFWKQPGGKVRPLTEDVDRIYKEMLTCYNPVIHKHSKWGHPVLIESYGHSNPVLLPLRAKQFAAVGQPFTEIAAKYHITANETNVRLSHYMDETFAKPRGTRVLGIIVVVDVEGLSMAHLSSDNLSMVQEMFGSDAKWYPEFIHKVLVINCPALIRLAYSLVTPFLDKRVQEKITFYGPGHATTDAMKEWIDEENIPNHLGGKCKCDCKCTAAELKKNEGKCMCGQGCVHFPTAAEVAKALEGTDATSEQRAELGVPIAAGASMTREFDMKVGDDCFWEWISDDERTVEFSVVFEPTSASANKSSASSKSSDKVVAADKIIKHNGNYVCRNEAGKIKLIFSNEFSWMRSKYLTLRCFVVPKPENIEVEGVPFSPAVELTASATAATVPSLAAEAETE